jgi:serine/threonine protein kinase
MTEAFIGDYQVKQKIGEGGTAEVYLVNCNQNDYAAKIFDITQTSIEQTANNEINVLQMLFHPNIIQMEGF